MAVLWLFIRLERRAGGENLNFLACGERWSVGWWRRGAGGGGSAVGGGGVV